MVELVVAVVGLASAGIFLAHAIDACHTENAESKRRGGKSQFGDPPWWSLI